MSTNQDPREIEGTPERAADRGRAEGFDVFASDKDNLGMIEVVDSLVRGFVGEVLDKRIAIHEEKLTPQDATVAIQEAAKRYADVFMGKSDEYEPMPWYTPEQLGAYISANYENAGEPDEAANAFFLRLAADVMMIAKRHEEGDLDDEVAQFQTDAAIEQACQVLMGIPDTEDPEEDGE